MTTCKYRTAIMCEEENCKRCGWNPKVETERKVQIWSELTWFKGDRYTLHLSKEKP